MTEAPLIVYGDEGDWVAIPWREVREITCTGDTIKVWLHVLATDQQRQHWYEAPREGNETRVLVFLRTLAP